MGGAGSAVLEVLSRLGLDLPVLCLGVPDQFTEHGDPKLLLQRLGLDAPGILKSIQTRFDWVKLIPQGETQTQRSESGKSADAPSLKRVV